MLIREFHLKGGQVVLTLAGISRLDICIGTGAWMIFWRERWTGEKRRETGDNASHEVLTCGIVESLVLCRRIGLLQ